MRVGCIVRFCAIIVCQVIVCAHASAQTANSYSSWSYSPSNCQFDDDGNCGWDSPITIYSTIVIDGSMTGGSYNHTYYADNFLQGSDGSHGSNNTTATAGPTTSAVSLRNDNQINAQSGVDYTFTRRAWAYCDFVGPSTPFYDSTSVFDYIGERTTYYENTRGYQDVAGRRFCGYEYKCANIVTPACPTATVSIRIPNSCPKYWGGKYLVWRTNPADDWNCGLAFGGPVLQVGICDPK